MQIEYTVQIWKEGEKFVAHAMPLDVMSAGQTPDEARKALDEAVHLFLLTAEEMGTISEVLEDAGYKADQENWIGPSRVAWEKRAAVLGA